MPPFASMSPAGVNVCQRSHTCVSVCDCECVYSTRRSLSPSPGWLREEVLKFFCPPHAYPDFFPSPQGGGLQICTAKGGRGCFKRRTAVLRTSAGSVHPAGPSSRPTSRRCVALNKQHGRQEGKQAARWKGPQQPHGERRCLKSLCTTDQEGCEELPAEEAPGPDGTESPSQGSTHLWSMRQSFGGISASQDCCSNKCC